MVGAVVVGHLQHLLDDIDMEDAPRIDDILPSQPEQVGRSLGKFLADGCLHLRKSEGHHKMCARGIIYMGVMVIGLEVHHPLEVNLIHFPIDAETKYGLHKIYARREFRYGALHVNHRLAARN